MPGACQPWKVRRASHPAEGPRAVAVLPPGDVLRVLTSVGLASFELAAKPCSLVPDQGEMGERSPITFSGQCLGVSGDRCSWSEEG